MAGGEANEDGSEDPPAPREERDPWRRTLLSASVLLSAGGSTLVITLLAWLAPLTYDEAYNWVTYRPLGWQTIATTYPLPNNHVPYTLMHVLVPARLVARSPWAVRMFAIGFGGVLMTVLSVVAARRGRSAFMPMLVVFGSPLLTSYLFIARSYTFCGLVLVAAALATGHIDVRYRVWRVVGAALLLALASWALPTNGFLLPGWVAFVWFLHGPKLAVIGAATYSAATAVVFAPIAWEVIEQSKFNWARGDDTIMSLPSRVTYAPALVMAIGVIAAARWYRGRRSGARAPLRTWSGYGRSAAAAASMCVSWCLAVPLTQLAGMQPMFYRNAIPGLWLIVLVIVIVAPRGRGGHVLMACLSLQVVMGAWILRSAVDTGRWDRVATVLWETTPVTIRDLKAGDADLVECSSFDSPVCLIAIPMLAERGIGVSLVDYPYADDVACVKGHRHSPEPYQVWVILRGERLGKICA